MATVHERQVLAPHAHRVFRVAFSCMHTTHVQSERNCACTRLILSDPSIRHCFWMQSAADHSDQSPNTILFFF
jgi:hypothetical protein